MDGRREDNGGRREDDGWEEGREMGEQMNFLENHPGSPCKAFCILTIPAFPAALSGVWGWGVSDPRGS